MRSTAKVDPTFRTAIRHARTEQRMTVDALAFAVGIGAATLNRIELAKHGADWATAEAIAQGLNIPLQKLVPSRPPRPRNEKLAHPSVDPAVTATVGRLRHEQGLSQQDLAHRASVSRQAVSRLERSITTNPRMSTMQAIAEGLGLSLPELINEIARTREGGQVHPSPAPGGDE